MEIIVPEHACVRMKERLGLNKKAFQRQAELAWSRGIKHRDTKSHLKKWIDKEALKVSSKANYYIVYNNHLFFFRTISEDSVVVLSMIKIPSNLSRDINKYFK